MTNRRSITIAAAIAVGLLLPVHASAESSTKPTTKPTKTKAAGWDIGPKRINAMVLPTGGATTAARLNIRITEWTSPEERAMLQKAFLAGGQDALLEAMQDLDHGNVSLPRTLGWDLSYAYTVLLEDGKRIVRIVTERPIFLYETVNSTRSRDYEFGIIEIVFGADGKGEGSVIPAAQIKLEDGKIVLQTRPNQYGPHKLVNAKMQDLKK